MVCGRTANSLSVGPSEVLALPVQVTQACFGMRITTSHASVSMHVNAPNLIVTHLVNGVRQDCQQRACGPCWGVGSAPSRDPTCPGNYAG